MSVATTQMIAYLVNACSLTWQVELDKLQLLYNTKSAEWQLELKSLLESLAAELDAKWAETMR